METIIKELNTKSSWIPENKTKSGPFGMEIAAAEMTCDINGKRRYITAEWNTAGDEDICFEITDMSIYDTVTFRNNDIALMDKIRSHEDYKIFLDTEEAYESDYVEPCRKLAGMILDLMKDHGVDIDQ